MYIYKTNVEMAIELILCFALILRAALSLGGF